MRQTQIRGAGLTSSHKRAIINSPRQLERFHQGEADIVALLKERRHKRLKARKLRRAGPLVWIVDAIFRPLVKMLL
jgi:hypothetical protein